MRATGHVYEEVKILETSVCCLVKMSNVYYIQEFRIKKDIKEVEEALAIANKMISAGVEVPKTTFERLEYLREFLEQKLIDFHEKEGG